MEKKYIQKCRISEKVFQDGGTLLNMSVNVDELMELADDGGWVKLTIARRKTPSDKGATHYAYLDERKQKKVLEQDNQDLPL